MFQCLREKSAPFGLSNQKVHFFYGIGVWNFENARGAGQMARAVMGNIFRRHYNDR